MDKFPELVVIKIVKLVRTEYQNVKVLRLVCKKLKNVVDGQITRISPITVSLDHLAAASRQFPKIDTLNLKQAVMDDSLVQFVDDNSLEANEQDQEDNNTNKHEAQLLPVKPFYFHNLITLQLQYVFNYGMNIFKLVSLLSRQITNLELEFTMCREYDVYLLDRRYRENINSLLQAIKQINKLKILTLNNDTNDLFKEDLFSGIAQLVQLEELRMFGRIEVSSRQLTTLTNLRKIHIQDYDSLYWFKTVQDWVDFLSHFQFLHSFMVYKNRECGWELLEALVHFPNIQTVGVTLDVLCQNLDLHQHRVEMLVQTSKIKSQLFLHLHILSAYQATAQLDYLKAVPTTCIQALNLGSPSEEVCEYLQYVYKIRVDNIPFSNLQELAFEERHQSIESFFGLSGHQQLTYIKYSSQCDKCIVAFSWLPNLKYLQVNSYHVQSEWSVRSLQALSNLCAKGTLQHLKIAYQDTNITALVDSICVPGCRLHSITITLCFRSSIYQRMDLYMQGFKQNVRYMFDKFECVSCRIPDVYIIAPVFESQKVLQAAQLERRRRLLNTFSEKLFLMDKQD